jgi:cytochrome c oxidase assembly factor CtaG
MNEPPRWIPVLFGAVSFAMGALILGAFLGIVPTDGGRFSAPPAVIVALGIGLILFAALLWAPRSTPASLKSSLVLLALVLTAVVCNWTAFAPEVMYFSSTSIGPIAFSGPDQLGGRIVFGLAALLVDAVILAVLVGWVRAARRGKGTRM